MSMPAFPLPDSPPPSPEPAPTPEPVLASQAALTTQPPPAPAAGPDVVSYQEELAAIASDLDAIDAALTRLDNQEFDVCSACGSSIGRDRLLRDPLLTTCEEHTAR